MRLWRILLILFIFFLFSLNVVTAANNLQNAFEPKTLDKAAGGAGYTTDANVSIEGTISVIIKTALSFLGVIFLILMIYGGYLWMTAGGNEQQVEKAKSLITAAIIGLIIVVSAYAISYFVMAKLDGGALK